MPRKQFLRDLEKAQSSTEFSQIHAIRKGEDDESLCFSYLSSQDAQLKVDFQVAVSDLTEYPDSHQYLIFSTSATVPTVVIDVIEVVQAAVAGSSILELLSTLNDALEKTALTGIQCDPGQDQANTDALDADSIVSEDDFDDTNHWDDEYFDEDQQFFGAGSHIFNNSSSLKSDLRVTKAAGFKVGYLGDLNGPIILTVSCRISKLGISEEAMQAWDVRDNQYIVLLLHFPGGYVSTEHLLGKPSLVQMHVGLCESYKPGATEAAEAFKSRSATRLKLSEPKAEPNSCNKLLPFFLETSLGSLLNERFIAILKLRHRYQLPWSGAESLFNNSQGLVLEDDEACQARFASYRATESWNDSLPRLVQEDHFSSTNELELLSFPLLAIQFTLRHFVRCTEFCIVCHCKIDATFEALKPYVCSKPLCLYQFMTLGQAPSLDWEICRQPLVVDLLISFAYSSAYAGIMEDLPVGLRMKVPPLCEGDRSKNGTLYESDEGITIKMTDNAFPIESGDWIMIEQPYIDTHNGRYRFLRVRSTEKWPVVAFHAPVTQYSTDAITTWTSNEPLEVKIYILDMNFDELDSAPKKQSTILALLHSLPDVMSMKSWLEAGHHGTRSLASWGIMPPAALDILRWIVASNRSCILQDSNTTGETDTTSCRDLVTGMKGYMQFRFAQGSPDKEEKFVSAVRDIGNNSKYPTIFAWHGSSICNWHGIIREGLHFKKVNNGRACGHGVYMSSDFDYSRTYSGVPSKKMVGTLASSRWLNSVLKVETAIALNEVVNRPRDFVYHVGNVYVVDRIEWIQTRYLFVNVNPSTTTRSATPVEPDEMNENAYYVQDPQHTPTGSDMKCIKIPMTAFSRRRRTLASNNSKNATVDHDQSCKSKKRKGSSSHKSVSDMETEGEEDDDASVATLAGDLAILLSDDDDDDGNECDEIETSKQIKRLRCSSTLTVSTTAEGKPSRVTSFRPGTLTESSIKLLEPPSYASSSATIALQQRLLQALKVQSQTPLDELGWYIDPQLINNPYQWIVEIHSFELSHPLGQDLHEAGIQSIILEMRFPSEFPMSPPFVRVVRPRLLEFSYGGGGHVTTGGALCMELLTGSGWLPTFSIENVLLSIRLAMCSMDPKPARLAKRGSSRSLVGGDEYSVREAVDAYVRACQGHGWHVPKDIQKMVW